MKPSDEQIDQLNADEWRDDSTQSIDQEVSPEQRLGTNGPIAHSPKSQGNQNDDDYGVEYDSRKHGRLRSEEHTSELQSPCNLVCRLLLEKKKNLALTDTYYSVPLILQVTS